MRSQIKVLLLACSVVLLSTGAMLAGSRQYLSTLVGITTIAYRSHFENELLTRRCEIDLYAWDAAIHIVANETNKLKLISNNEYKTHLDVLRANYDELAKSTPFSDDAMSAFNTAQRDFENYNSIPKLVLSVTSVATREGGCFGWIDAVLELENVTPAKRIWYESRHFYHSGKNYTAKVIDPAASVIKTLVSDWTYAQTNLRTAGDSGGVMPGVSPGQASPRQPPPCMVEFAPLRTETEKGAVAIKAAAAKRAPPQELCPLFVHFIEAEAKVVKFMEQRAASCGIPAQVVSVTKANHQKALQTKERVCAAAGERERPRLWQLLKS